MMIELRLAGLFQRATAIPLVELLLWTALVTLTITLIVLLRTGWGQARPLRQCAVLSLLVHVLLACVAMTVRIVVGDGGTALGPPIRVRIVEETILPAAEPDAALSQSADATPPPLMELPAVELDEPIHDPQPDALAVESEPPSDADESTPPPREVAAERDPARLPTSEPEAIDEAVALTEGDDQREDAPDPLIATDSADSPAMTPTHLPPSQASGPASVPAVPAPYVWRTDPDRRRIVESQGGNRRTEAAVAAALEWLAAAQSPDGRWEARRFGAGRELAVLGHQRNGAGRQADTGISALALLAFLGAGHTHARGPHQQTVERGLDFLLQSQAADGNLFGNAALYAQMYCHAMATFALAEALAMTGDKRLEPAVARAVDFSLRAQHAAGGWRYRAGDRGDTSLLGWKVMALASAERAGLSTPSPTWAGVERFLRSVQRGRHAGLASYRPDGPASTPMTAEAFYCWLLLEQTTGVALDESAAVEATSQLLATLPQTEPVNLYYWYYATLALHHRQAGGRARDAWHTWNDALTKVLLASQVADGGDAGSWPPDCIWGGYGGRIYSTALAALCLEVYYRYAPAPDLRDPSMATRQEPAGAVR